MNSADHPLAVIGRHQLEREWVCPAVVLSPLSLLFFAESTHSSSTLVDARTCSRAAELPRCAYLGKNGGGIGGECGSLFVALLPFMALYGFVMENLP